MNKHSYLLNFLSELPDFVYSFIQNYYDGESVNTQIGYSIDIRIFLKYLNMFKFKQISRLEDFTPEHMNQVTVDDFIGFKAYLREYTTETTNAEGKIITRTLHNSANGINRKLSSVRGLFIYLYKTDKISQNVTDKVDFASISQKIKKPLTTQEIVRLIDVIFNGEKYFEGRYLTEYNKNKLRDIAIFTTYLGTGIRVSELVNLNIADICFETSSFIVTRKGGDEQEIFMPIQVGNAIAEYKEYRDSRKISHEALFISRKNDRMTVSAIEKMLKKYCLVANITHPDKTNPHALRRTFACRLLEDGVDIKMVAELLGHKNIEVTHKYYAQYSSKARKEIMQSLDVLPIEEQD